MRPKHLSCYAEGTNTHKNRSKRYLDRVRCLNSEREKQGHGYDAFCNLRLDLVLCTATHQSLCRIHKMTHILAEDESTNHASEVGNQ